MKKLLFFTLLGITIPLTKSFTNQLTESEKKLFRMFQLQGEIIDLIQKRYYQQADMNKAFMRGLTEFSHLDPHSTLLNEESCKELQEKTSGEFFGIGVVLPGDKDQDDEFITVIDTIPGGPADIQGVKTGDKIIQINDDIVKGMSIDEVSSKLRGERNTNVMLKILRASYPEPLTIKVTRDIIKDEASLVFYLPEHLVYYIMLPMFSEKSAAHIEQLLKKASGNKTCNGIILDLRNNTGGLFDSAIEIAGLFLPKKSLVAVTKNRDKKVVEEWHTNRTPIAPKRIPIFVLVNNYTASAGEILAGCLKLHALHMTNLPVFLVGERTFGKGSVQEVIPLINNCALKLTTALYYLPYDTSIQGKGIEPDIIIEHRNPPSETSKWVTAHYGRESALKGSIKDDIDEQKTEKKDGEKKKEEKSWQEKRKEQIAKDYIIQNTLTLINILQAGIKANPKELANRAAMVTFLQKTFSLDKPIKLDHLSL